MAGIHYFQRYHGKENVHTANAFLLINRLYQYKPQYFYKFLDALVEDEQSGYDFRINMTLQAKAENKKGSTVPDAMIVQNGYRLCVEAKIEDWFYIEQIEGHLKAFDALDTKYKIFLSLSNKNECGIAPKIKNLVSEFNKKHELSNEDRLIYRHLSFEMLVEIIENILSERDYEFIEVLDDYREYCQEQGLIDNKYQLMMAYASSATVEINKKLRLYYRKAPEKPNADFLGLYSNKKVVAIGRIHKIVKASMPADEVVLEEGAQVTDDELERIREAIVDSANYDDYNLRTVEHNFIFVEEFVDCNFEKTSKGGLMSGKYFELENDYGIEKIKEKTVAEIAEELSRKTWC
ncbi:MAG: hypothetical protein IKU84_05060 [Clostridia bacterium]|nr:hypothetical protein [Clostridia bacterium]